MKNMDVRYNFYTAMAKVVNFYKDYLEAKKPTKEEIRKEAIAFSPIFDVEVYVDTELEWWEEVDSLTKDIKDFFATPIRTISDLVNKGQILMELNERIELFEYWNC